MKKTKRYEDGGEVDGEVDALEAANQSKESQDIADQAKGDAMLVAMRDEAAKPKAKPAISKPKPAMSKPKPATSTPAPEAKPVDETKMSVSDRFKMSRERARAGSGPTDTRSVSQRLRAAFGMAKGGSVSSRADGIAQRGKTKGRMC